MSTANATETCSRCGNVVPPSRTGICLVCWLGAALPPTEIDGIELLEEIGQGGMGTVYRGRHERLARTVAVKFLGLDLADRPEFRTRFEREAKLLARLSHENIVGVYDFGETEGQPYLVMEFIEGETLSDVLPVTPDRAVEIGVEICRALAYAHEQGVVHRDIKPANVLLDPQGRVKLTDFGIARLTGREEGFATITRTNTVIGTPFYMAPEAAAGAAPEPRMDLFSVGVLLYKAVTGFLPRGNFAPLPEPLDAIVRRALEPQPDDRWESAAEMRDALQGTADALAAAPPGPPPRRGWLGYAAAAAVVGAVGIAVVRPWSPRERATPTPTATATLAAAASAPASSPVQTSTLAPTMAPTREPTRAPTQAPTDPLERSTALSRVATPSPTPTPTATPVAPEGVLRIQVIPWADVTVNGNALLPRAEPPHRDYPLEPGTYVVILRNPVTGQHQAQTVTVEDGEQSFIEADLR